MKDSLVIMISIFLSAIIGLSGISVIHPGIGEKAPEIALPDINGDTLKLTELRGKVVLVDFWASWCRTCRIENKTFSAAYNRFKDSGFKDGQGFEVFSVSLDGDAKQWKNAISNDRMSWKYHVSDLKKWDSPVIADYNFKYIPHNLIIDKNGKVIAKELYGSRLIEFLESRLSE